MEHELAPREQLVLRALGHNLEGTAAAPLPLTAWEYDRTVTSLTIKGLCGADRHHDCVSRVWLTYKGREYLRATTAA